MTLIIKNIQTAIYSAFDGDATLKAAVTGMYFSEAPQGTAYPFITYHIIDGTSFYTFDTTSKGQEHLLVQFSIFDDSPSSETAADVLKKLCDVYDACTLSITDYGFVKMMRRSYNVMRTEGVSEGERVWQYNIDYDLWAYKS